MWRLLSIPLLCLLATAAQNDSAAPPLLFVVTGQSNAGQLGIAAQLPEAQRAPLDNASYYAPQLSGRFLPLAPVNGTFGVELSFARAIRAACPERAIIVVKRWRNATGIEAWQPPRELMYQRVMATVGRAQELYGAPVDVAGFLWLQNEFDSRTTALSNLYQPRLTALVTAVRDDWDAPALPIVLMGVHTSGAGAGLISDALGAVAADMPPVAIVQTNDLSLKDDGVHFDSAGLTTLGERYAAAWLTMTGGCD